MIKSIKIGDKIVKDDSDVFVIAELSANHNQNFEVAVETIKAVKDSGADAIKIQTYTADTMTIDCSNDHFQRTDGLWKGKNLYQIYKEAFTPWEWQPRLKEIAENLGLIFFSSPFDRTAVDFLEKMDVPAYKIASPEITDIPLIEYTASKGKPMIISTGIASLADIELAVNTCKKTGNSQIAILKCTTAYPAPYAEMNLRTIADMRKTLNLPIGLSDHTLGDAVAIGAIGTGAILIEKHFILDRSLGGPDAPFSMEPKEFKQMVASIRIVSQALGKVVYDDDEIAQRKKRSARSLFVVENIKCGELFTEQNVRSIRPGNGLHPKHYFDILGKVANSHIEKGTPLNFNLIGE
jgi:pseudaminic acid synthase